MPGFPTKGVGTRTNRGKAQRYIETCNSDLCVLPVVSLFRSCCELAAFSSLCPLCSGLCVLCVKSSPYSCAVNCQL